ncbi:MAG TPA: motility protein A [Acidobacteriota bacterium]|nr:motility protein A [Acidobacteriota bacterium]
MDISTVLGFLVGFGLVLGSIILGNGLGFFIDPMSMMIVLGGTFGATLIAFPLADIQKLISALSKAFFHKAETLKELVPRMVEFARVARRDGVLALENVAGEASDLFMHQGIQLVVDGTEPELTRQILETELEKVADRHRIGSGILEAMGNFSPAFGMIGTLIGLIFMLQSLDDPSSIGPKMSIALVTTFYGALLANLVFLPLAEKLKKRSNEELLFKEMTMAGILSIQSGDVPRIVEQKLNTFLPPGERATQF